MCVCVCVCVCVCTCMYRFTYSLFSVLALQQKLAASEATTQAAEGEKKKSEGVLSEYMPHPRPIIIAPKLSTLDPTPETRIPKPGT